MNRGFLKRRIGTFIGSLENQAHVLSDSEQKQGANRSEVVTLNNVDNQENSSGPTKVSEAVPKPSITKVRSRFPKPKPNVKLGERKAGSSVSSVNNNKETIKSDNECKEKNLDESKCIVSNTSFDVCGSAEKFDRSSGGANQPTLGLESSSKIPERKHGTPSSKDNEEKRLGVECVKECNDNNMDQAKKTIIPNIPMDSVDDRTSEDTQPAPVLEQSLPIRSRFPRCKPNLKIPERRLGPSVSKGKEGERSDIQHVKEYNDNIVDQAKAAVSGMLTDNLRDKTSEATNEPDLTTYDNTPGGTNQQNSSPQPGVMIRSRFPRAKPNLKRSDRRPDAHGSKDTEKARLDIATHCVKEQDHVKNDQVEAVLPDDSANTVDLVKRCSSNTSEKSPVSEVKPINRPCLPTGKVLSTDCGEKLDTNTVLLSEEEELQTQNDKHDVKNDQVEVINVDDSEDTADSTSSGSTPLTRVVSQVGAMIIPVCLANRKQVPSHVDGMLHNDTSKGSEDVYILSDKEQSVNQKDEPSSAECEAVVGALRSAKDDESSSATTKCEVTENTHKPSILRRSRFQRPKPNFRKFSSNFDVNASKDRINEKQAGVQNEREQTMNTEGEPSSVESEVLINAPLPEKVDENSSTATKCEVPENMQKPTILRRSRFQRPKPNFRKFSSNLDVNASKDSVKEKQAGVQNERQPGSKTDQVEVVVQDYSSGTVDLEERFSNDTHQIDLVSEAATIIKSCLPSSKYVLTVGDGMLDTSTSKESEEVHLQNDKEQNNNKKGEPSLLEPEAVVDASLSSKEDESSSATIKCNLTEHTQKPGIQRMRSCFQKPKPNFSKCSSKLNTSASKDSAEEKQTGVQNDREQNVYRKEETSVMESEAVVDKSLSGKKDESSSTAMKCEEPENAQKPTILKRSCFHRPKPSFRKFNSKLNVNTSKESVEDKHTSVQNDRKPGAKTHQAEVVLDESNGTVEPAERSSNDAHQTGHVSEAASIMSCLSSSKGVSLEGDEKLDTSILKENEEVHVQSDREQDMSKENETSSVESEALINAPLPAKVDENSSTTTKCEVPENMQKPTILRRSRFQRPKPNFRKFSSNLDVNTSKDSVKEKQAGVQNERQHDKKNDKTEAVVPDGSAANTGDSTEKLSGISQTCFVPEVGPSANPCLSSSNQVSTDVAGKLDSGISIEGEVCNQNEKQHDVKIGNVEAVVPDDSADTAVLLEISGHDIGPESKVGTVPACVANRKEISTEGDGKLDTDRSKESEEVHIQSDKQNSAGKNSVSESDNTDIGTLRSLLEGNDCSSKVKSRKRKSGSKDNKEVPEKSPDPSNLDRSENSLREKTRDKTDKNSVVDSDASSDTVLYSEEGESAASTTKSVDSQRKLGTVKVKLHLPKPKPNLKRVNQKPSTSVSKGSREKQGNVCNDRQKLNRKKSRSDNTDSDVVSPLKERNDISSEAKSCKRKCALKANKEGQEKRRARHKICDHEAMTILDLIYWNPPESPVRPTSSDSIQGSGQGDNSAADSTEENVDCPSEKQTEQTKEHEKETDANCAQGPQVTIGANGEITIDESSLVVQQAVDTENLDTVTISEDGNTTYSSFRSKPNNRVWDDNETKKFYQALSTVGTDFTLMSELFGNRSRRELKLKYKREERHNRSLVDRALDSPPVYNLEMFRHDGDGNSGDANQEGGNAEKSKKTRKRRRKVTEDLNVDADSDVHQDPPKKKKRTQRRSRKKQHLSSSDEEILSAEPVSQNQSKESEKTDNVVYADECQNSKDGCPVADVSSTVIELIVFNDGNENESSHNELVQGETTLLEGKLQSVPKVTSKTQCDSENVKAGGFEQSDIDVVEQVLCSSQNCATKTVQECLLSSNKYEETVLTGCSENNLDNVVELSASLPVEVIKTGEDRVVSCTKEQCSTDSNKDLPDVLLSPFVSETSSEEIANPHKFLFLPRQGPSNEQVIHVFLVKDMDASQEGNADGSSCKKSNGCDAGESNQNENFIDLASKSEYCVSKCESNMPHKSLDCTQNITDQNAVP